jgi:hypothetical protein
VLRNKGGLACSGKETTRPSSRKHAADNKPDLSQIAAAGRELLEVGNRECPVFV